MTWQIQNAKPIKQKQTAEAKNQKAKTSLYTREVVGNKSKT